MSYLDHVAGDREFSEARELQHGRRELEELVVREAQDPQEDDAHQVRQPCHHLTITFDHHVCRRILKYTS